VVWHNECIDTATTSSAATLPALGGTALANISTLVRHGDQRGRLLGFPTANLHPPEGVSVPRGVYAARARTADGEWWPAAVNIGTRPTFAGATDAVTIEVHLIGFSGDLYDQPLTVSLLCRLRHERRFPSVTSLVAQLRVDVAAALDTVRRSTS